MEEARTREQKNNKKKKKFCTVLQYEIHKLKRVIDNKLVWNSYSHTTGGNRERHRESRVDA